jgi:hypothetical protein
MKKFFILLLLVNLVNGCGFLRATDVEFPLVQAVSHFPYFNHSTLDKNGLRVSLDLYYSNIYTYDYERTYVLDMESLGSTLGIRYGLARGITLELYYRSVAVFGGILDRLIVDFHKTFGLSEGGRNDFPRNQVNYTYKNAFSYTGSTWGQPPLVLGAVGRLYTRGNFSLNGRIALGVPLSSKPGFSSGKLFLTTGVIFLYRRGDFSLDFANHISFFKNPAWLEGVDIRGHVFHSEMRVDYKRVFAGLLYRSTPFKWAELSNGAYQVYVGVKIGKYLELSLVEEFPPNDTTPDVSFRLRINLI